jgi:4-hydroxybenzoate polyprenyltransferase
LTHPFPSLLDGLVVAAVALVAGADGPTAVRLGVAMTLLQASIGTLNDLVDAPRDAVSKPAKPIPAGLVSRSVAWAVVVGGGGLGVVLALGSGAATGLLAVVVLAIGYGYDLVAKGTVWSWLPFAIGIPLLPVFGWLGATGGLAPRFALLIPVAVVAGAALAIANARADAERDVSAGIDSIAVRLGLERSWTVHAVLLAVVLGAAIVTVVASGASTAAQAGVVGASLVVTVGAWLGRHADRSRRERSWEMEAVGVALLAAAWLAGVPLDR